MTPIPAKCPCCGQMVKPQTDVWVDLQHNTVVFRDRSLRLPAQECELMASLVDRMPGVASYDYIIRSLWGVNEIPCAEIRVKVVVHKLRRKLMALGLGISNYATRGYGLVVLPKLQTERTGKFHAQA